MMRRRRRRETVIMAGKILAAGALAAAAFVTPFQILSQKTLGEMKETVLATDSNGAEESATSGNALRAPALLSQKSAALGEIWEGWIGDLSFLDGTSGDGTEEKPYQISTRAQLMGLSQLAARGMVCGEEDGVFPGDYKGACFELAKNIDLGGMNWIPIGFYRSEAELLSGNAMPFMGHFDGNGKTVSNFRLGNEDWSDVGLFGFVEDSEIENLTVKPGNVIRARERLGILSGRAKNSEIRNVTVMGSLKAAGTVGGVVGEISEETIVENCMADHVAIDGGTKKEVFAGGIAGSAAGSLILDCTVNTGETKSARLQGGGYVGGIVGFQNDTDVYNVHVMGTIGGAGSQSAGGITGKYASGKLKVARFEGEIGDTGLGGSAREGAFIGTHDTGFHFRYGTEEGADLAYLFSDREETIAAGVCGCQIPEDNTYSYEDHVGFWHMGDNFYTLLQGQNGKSMEEQYFYEELEEGVLHVIDTEEAVLSMDCAPDHFAPNAVGRPVRGYLASVLQVDTAANVGNYYDVAVLTARGESFYSKTLDKTRRGAIAAGDTVTVTTAPKNTEEAKYQMDGAPTYTDENGRQIPMDYQTGGTYRFVMPAHDTEISAVYKKVAAEIRVEPEEFAFHVVQERSGDRKNPSIVTEVTDGGGKLIARYINGELEEGTRVQKVQIAAIVDKNNDVADESTAWSVDDPELIHLLRNEDEDSGGYTKKSASIELNLEADFFTDILAQAERDQAAKDYQYPIPDTVYGNGTLGGIAVLTAQTRPAASFEGKPLTANCRIPVTFQIKDRTRVAAEGARFDKEELEFTVTRRLSGDRRKPEETISVTAPQTLFASFSPDFFDKKDISWTVDDPYVIRLEAGSYGETNGGEEDGGEENDGGDYKNAAVWAVKDAKWIRDLMAVDDAVLGENPYAKREGKGSRTAKVTVTADDLLGNRQRAVCPVTVRFETVDRTEIRPEKIELDKKSLTFDMTLTKTGPSKRPVLSWEGNGPQKIAAAVYPKEAGTAVSWEYDPAVLSAANGEIAPVTEAVWIQEAMKKYPYKAELPVKIMAKAGEIQEPVEVVLKFQMVNKTYSSGGSGSGGSGGSGSGGSGSGFGGLGNPGVSGSVNGTENGRRPSVLIKDSVTGTWEQNEAGRWQFTSGGRMYSGEWAYIQNPYAKAGQETPAWFLFDGDGTMHTGWYQDPASGKWYFLHDQPDGSQGHMYTGWHRIGGLWYYFGSDGQMDVGWNWIDGKCYCLDEKNGNMYENTTTPDGYTVDENGAWTVKGVVQTLGDF